MQGPSYSKSKYSEAQARERTAQWFDTKHGVTVEGDALQADHTVKSWRFVVGEAVHQGEGDDRPTVGPPYLHRHYSEQAAAEDTIKFFQNRGRPGVTVEQLEAMHTEDHYRFRLAGTTGRGEDPRRTKPQRSKPKRS